MPIYLFENPITGEIKEIVQSIHEKHVYSEGGVNFPRIFTVPQASFDTKIDANSPKDFVNKTSNKKGKLGDLFDQSAELSLRRGGNSGVDPIKEQYYKNYKKERKNKVLHPDVRKKKAVEKLNKLGVEVSL
jgi:hypothetical protein